MGAVFIETRRFTMAAIQRDVVLRGRDGQGGAVLGAPAARVKTLNAAYGPVG